MSPAAGIPAAENAATIIPPAVTSGKNAAIFLASTVRQEKNVSAPTDRFPIVQAIAKPVLNNFITKTAFFQRLFFYVFIQYFFFITLPRAANWTLAKSIRKPKP